MGIRVRDVLVAIVLVLGVLGTAPARAQGGPPMITDDPGTPGDGNWEVNIALLSDSAGGISTYQTPLIDMNYGVGDRLQLKFEMPWLVARGDGTTRDGAGNGLLGVKWRFYDAGDEGWQISTYPQLQFGFPITHSSRNGLADPGTDLLVPFEFERDTSVLDFDFELGRWIGQAPLSNTWIAGLAIGHEVADGWELLAELHDDMMQGGARGELTLNFGTRWKISEEFSLLLSAGRDLHDSIAPASRFISYVGMQARF